MPVDRTVQARGWRSANPERRREINHESIVRVRARNRAILTLAKAGPCMDCGRSFPKECMDLDHREGEVKKRGVGLMMGVSEAMLLAEIAKCDVVCANCHRIRTNARRIARAGL